MAWTVQGNIKGAKGDAGDPGAAFGVNVGDGASTEITVTHGLGTRDVTVSVHDNATYEEVECDVFKTTTNSITLKFGTAPASNAYRCVVSSGGGQQGPQGIQGTTAWDDLTGKPAMPSGTIVGTTDTQELSGKTLVNPTLKNYTESVVAIGTVTTSATIDLTNGTVQTATLTASTACTFTMPTPVAGKSFTLLLKQAAATGNGTATFTGVKWGSAGTPTITATAGTMDILSFFSDGVNWYGSLVQGYTP